MSGIVLDRVGNRITVGMIGECLSGSALAHKRRFVVLGVDGEVITVTTTGHDTVILHRSMLRGVGHTDLHASNDIVNGFRSEWVGTTR